MEGASRGSVDLAVDTPQEEFGQSSGGELAAGVWFGVNHVLKIWFHQTEMETPLVKRGPHPNLVFLLEVVVEFLEEFLCCSIRTDLDELNAELDARVRSVASGPNQHTWERVAPALSSRVAIWTMASSASSAVRTVSFTWRRLKCGDLLGRPSVMTI